MCYASCYACLCLQVGSTPWDNKTKAKLHLSFTTCSKCKSSTWHLYFISVFISCSSSACGCPQPLGKDVLAFPRLGPRLLFSPAAPRISTRSCHILWWHLCTAPHKWGTKGQPGSGSSLGLSFPPWSTGFVKEEGGCPLPTSAKGKWGIAWIPTRGPWLHPSPCKLTWQEGILSRSEENQRDVSQGSKHHMLVSQHLRVVKWTEQRGWQSREIGQSKSRDILLPPLPRGAAQTWAVSSS